jgi:hypothetical protein
MQQKQEVLKRAKKNIYLVVIRIFILFSLPAIVGLFLGRWIDQTYNVRPWGSFGTLIVFYATTWVLIAVFHKRILSTIEEAEADMYPTEKSGSKQKSKPKRKPKWIS